jgi:hypothetical protein
MIVKGGNEKDPFTECGKKARHERNKRVGTVDEEAFN